MENVQTTEKTQINEGELEKQFSPCVVKLVKDLKPIDDVMFQKMCEDKETLQEIISTILGEKVVVETVIPQNSIQNLQGRSVRLDALCIRENGAYVLVEVQRSDNDDHERRVRYNASVVTANATPKSTKFKDVKNVTSIYISQFDIFGAGLPVYHIDRTVRETGEVRNNGFIEIYVNAVSKDRSSEKNANVSDLMKLFIDPDEYDFHKFPAFSARKHIFKNTQKGAVEMGEKVEEYFRQQRMIDLFEYVQEGGMSVSFAARKAKLDVDDFKVLMANHGYQLPEAVEPVMA